MSNKAIWKYPVGGGGMISVPAGGIIRHLGIQGGQPHLWIEVDPAAEPEHRLIRMIGTGHYFDSDAHRYIGTIQDPPFVWHFYEAVDPA